MIKYLSIEYNVALEFWYNVYIEDKLLHDPWTILLMVYSFKNAWNTRVYPPPSNDFWCTNFALDLLWISLPLQKFVKTLSFFFCGYFVKTSCFAFLPRFYHYHFTKVSWNHCIDRMPSSIVKMSFLFFIFFLRPFTEITWKHLSDFPWSSGLDSGLLRQRSWVRIPLWHDNQNILLPKTSIFLISFKN